MGGSLPLKTAVFLRKEHSAPTERQGGGKPGAAPFVPTTAKKGLIDKHCRFGKQKEVYKTAREPTVLTLARIQKKKKKAVKSVCGALRAGLH